MWGSAAALPWQRSWIAAPCEPSFQFAGEEKAVIALMRKYVDVPMSFADACLVRMTELLAEPIVLTTDSDFRIYRRHGRQAVPCVLPP